MVYFLTSIAVNEKKLIEARKRALLIDYHVALHITILLYLLTLPSVSTAFSIRKPKKFNAKA